MCCFLHLCVTVCGGSRSWVCFLTLKTFFYISFLFSLLYIFSPKKIFWTEKKFLLCVLKNFSSPFFSLVTHNLILFVCLSSSSPMCTHSRVFMIRNTCKRRRELRFEWKKNHTQKNEMKWNLFVGQKWNHKKIEFSRVSFHRARNNNENENQKKYRACSGEPFSFTFPQISLKSFFFHFTILLYFFLTKK